MEDKQLVCLSCGCEFVFTKEEQDFFALKGYYEPRHCLACRAKRREERNRPRRQNESNQV